VVQRAREEPKPLQWHRAIPFAVLAFLVSLATLMTAWFAFPQGTVDLDEISEAKPLLSPVA
jgi:hypothetical protein